MTQSEFNGVILGVLVLIIPAVGAVLVAYLKVLEVKLTTRIRDNTTLTRETHKAVKAANGSLLANKKNGEAETKEKE
jgi:hypothetical protein